MSDVGDGAESFAIPQGTIIDSKIHLQSSQAISIYQTVPSGVVFHIIKDEELDIMMMSDTSVSQTVSATIFGAGLGFVQNVFVVLRSFAASNSTPPDLWNIIAALICVFCVGVGGSVFLMSLKHKSTAQTLGASIKSRLSAAG